MIEKGAHSIHDGADKKKQWNCHCLSIHDQINMELTCMRTNKDVFKVGKSEKQVACIVNCGKRC
jgi:hypothetical protein